MVNYYAIIYTPGPSWKKGKTVYQQELSAHGEYMAQLLERNILIAGGPFIDNSGGLAILRARNLKEAQDIINHDPAIENSVFNASLRPWHVAYQDFENK
ncbi:MAG: hypothetical protein GF315_14305 [candidate division Zixibacteria bacterium]|nr:hypothetical protein [candidate division Zixibacteria bacterium]